MRIGYIASVTKGADQPNKIAADRNVIETHEHKDEFKEGSDYIIVQGTETDYYEDEE